MGLPELLRVALTVVFAAITLTCVARLLTRPRAGLPARHDDLAHVVKGVGMIAMLLSWTRLVPMPLWVLVFACLAAFFAALLLRSTGGAENWDHVDHVVGSIGMIYMLFAMGGATGGMAGMPASPLAMSFGLYFLAFGLWSGVRALRPVAVAGSPVVLGRPMLVHGCRALAAGGMAYLLLAS